MEKFTFAIDKGYDSFCSSDIYTKIHENSITSSCKIMLVMLVTSVE